MTFLLTFPFTLSLRVMNRLRAPYGGACAGHKFEGNFGKGAGGNMRQCLETRVSVKTRWADWGHSVETWKGTELTKIFCWDNARIQHCIVAIGRKGNKGQLMSWQGGGIEVTVCRIRWAGNIQWFCSSKISLALTQAGNMWIQHCIVAIGSKGNKGQLMSWQGGGIEVTWAHCGKSLGKPIISVIILYISNSIIVIITNIVVSLEKILRWRRERESRRWVNLKNCCWCCSDQI